MGMEEEGCFAFAAAWSCALGEDDAVVVLGLAWVLLFCPSALVGGASGSAGLSLFCREACLGVREGRKSASGHRI